MPVVELRGWDKAHCSTFSGDSPRPAPRPSVRAEQPSVLVQQPFPKKRLRKRARVVESGLSLEPEVFIPVALSVWDGFAEERGNKRGLTSWFSLYLEPLEKKSPVIPMLIWGGGALLVELLIVVMVRRRAARA